ncbi:substrate-binding domain-containing protein [Spirosoma montaniterrae]|uniref:LacI family transcriptional regulator n=1 Tax=Spirosoma montaniterrae TaxID=1178516 RepID=A0A1P9WV43_9BACT|nr:substrate-binding domain-containing protein [Spirosoma montaniterrae]AQG79241.1 LacI family transcriptional regulator [Spirosoma montaniterrae]
MKLQFLFLLLLVACEPPPRTDNTTATDADTVQLSNTEPSPNEEYVMVTTAINLPLYVNHDQAAFRAWGQKTGVRISILGPSDWDVPAQIQTIEQVIGTRPAGLLINGTDPGIAQAINKAVDAGIPTVVYDSEVPGSRAPCFIGSDWYDMGRLQGERMVKLLNGRGKVACLGILGMANQEAGFQGMLDVFKKHPGIQFVGKYDDKGNFETAARTAADILAAHPDLAGFCGFDSQSGPGAGLAVKEAGRAGKLKITTVDAEPEHLKLVREGVIDYLVGQKRELFTWYGAQFLFDMAHGTNRFSANDRRAGIAPIPQAISTGAVEIDRQNIANFRVRN